MRRLAFMVAGVLSFLTAAAQYPGFDHEPTSKGRLTIQPVFHAAIVLSWDDKQYYIDPYGGAKAFEGLLPPDVILITDIHPDHFDTATLNKVIRPATVLVVPEAVALQLPPALRSHRVVVLHNGQTTSEQGVVITAVPMYNLPEEADSRHPRGRGNGYLLDMGGKRVYVSGDTEDIPEMKALKNIDIAFVCMNLPYTMDINQAAAAVLAFNPTIIYPYHYRNNEGFSDVKAFAQLVKERNPNIEVRLKNWYIQN